MQQHTLLYVEDKTSSFNETPSHLDTLFKKVDKVSYYDEALHLLKTNTYDIVLYDISMHPKKVKFIKQIQEKKSMQTIFVLLEEKDEDLAFGLSQLGVNVLVINPVQLDEALKNIALFNPKTGEIG